MGHYPIGLGADERRGPARRDTRCGDLPEDWSHGAISDAYRDCDRGHQNELQLCECELSQRRRMVATQPLQETVWWRFSGPQCEPLFAQLAGNGKEECALWRAR